MSYVRKLVGHDEKLIGVAHLHWIYVVRGALWWLLTAAIGAGCSYLISKGAFDVSTWQEDDASIYVTLLLNLEAYTFIFFSACGFIFFLSYLLKYLVSEVALTSRRVVHKEGFFSVHVREVDLSEVMGETVDTGGVGRFFNYGYLFLDCRFIGDVHLPAIPHAEAFLKAIHHYRLIVQSGASGQEPATDLPPAPEIHPAHSPHRFGSRTAAEIKEKSEAEEKLLHSFDGNAFKTEARSVAEPRHGKDSH